MDKLKDLNEIKHKLIDWIKVESAKGFESPEEVEIMGEVVDMIKDLASAEKDCMEACYYETVTEAMSEGEERKGYDNWRYASGRFAPKGRGTRTGYTTPYMNDMPETYMPDMMRAGYTQTVKPAERLDKTMDMMGDIWAESDMDTRRKMKSLVADLMEQMEQSGV